MQTMPCLIRPGGLKYFVAWILSESPHIIYTLRIWYDQTFIYSNISNIIWRKFLSFERDISSRNSHNFEQDLTNHFGGFVQKLDGQIGLSRHTQRLLRYLKKIIICLFIYLLTYLLIYLFLCWLTFVKSRLRIEMLHLHWKSDMMSHVRINISGFSYKKGK
jgi:hypothetical protein